jgi:DNA-binding response OmpR family regulator
MKKILIFEDDRFLARTYTKALKPFQYETLILFDGEDAIKKAEEFGPDLIILDILLPVKDGFVILKELKQHDKLASVPVIISSNLGQPDDIQKGKALGANEFITKSETTLSQITSLVQKLLA